MATWSSLRCLGGLVLFSVAARAATEPGVADSARGRPQVAILHGTYDNNRHQAEHDGALAALAWPATKYALREVDRLVAALDQFDVVLGNPLFNYGPDTHDIGIHAEAWRRFLERGGAIVLTDCNYPTCVDWLARLGPECGMATAPCTATAPASVPAPRHPLLCLPNPWPVQNSWQHLDAVGSGWEAAARCGDGRAVVALQRVGRGLLVATTSWPLKASQLENVWTNLTVQRRGFALTGFEMTPPGVGPGKVVLGLRRLSREPMEAALRLELSPAGQPPQVTVGKPVVVPDTGGALVEVSYRIGARGPARIVLALDVPPQPVTLLDRQTVLPPLLAVTLRQPSYRGLALRSAWPGAAVLAATVVPAEEALRDLSLAASLCAPDGSELARTELREVAATEVGLRLPLAAVEPGRYVAGVRLAHRGRVVATAETPLTILPDTQSSVLIDDRLRLLVNGQPFFPLGMYHVGEADLPAVAALGFNTVQGWGGNLERARSFLDTAQANGLMVLLEMGGMVAETVDEGAIRAHIAAFAKHPALLAWYVRDEPSPELHANVRHAAELFRTLDPYHPTYMVSCRPAEFAAEAQLADIFAVDPYPLPGGQVAMVAQWAALAWAATRRERPVWIIPQAHDQSSYDRTPPERGARRPTAAQQRCMTWLALVYEAKGLIWYTWDDGPDMGAKFHAAQQQELKELCAEVRALALTLLDGDLRRFTAAEGRVHGLVCSTPSGRLLIVVNAADEAISTAFAVDEAGEGQRFSAVPSGPGVTAQGRRLSLDLAPLAVQVYRF